MKNQIKALKDLASGSGKAAPPDACRTVESDWPNYKSVSPPGQGEPKSGASGTSGSFEANWANYHEQKTPDRE